MTAQDQIYSIPTTLGASKLAYGLAMNQPVQIREMVLTDGGGQSFTPAASLEAMPNIVHRGLLNSLEQHPDNPRWVIAELVVPAEVGGFTIRGLGLVDVDGDLIFVGNHAEQYKPVQAQGSDETKTIRMVVLVSDVAAVTLRTDPSVVMATRAFTEGLVAQAATEATQAEAEEGENGTRKMTPRRVFQALRSAAANASETLRGVLRIGTQAEIDAGESAAVAVTPRTLMKGAGIHRRAEFFESGTWRCPSGVTRIHVTGCGGGGGGGGPSSGASSHGQGGGGAASAFCVSLDVTPGAEYIVSIGAGGVGGAVGGNGSAGGASSFGSLLTLAGGTGGLSAGSGSGGGSGFPAPSVPGTAIGGNGADGPAGGHGGASSFGGGGSARQSAGSRGAGWGSGGAGGRSGNAGGDGANGFLIVEW